MAGAQQQLPNPVRQSKNLTSQNARPERVMTDFELAAMNGFNREYPNVQQSGRFFHFSQNVYRCIQRAGLRAEYADAADFALKCRMMLTMMLRC